MSSAQERTAGYEPDAGTQAGGAQHRAAGAPDRTTAYAQPGYQPDNMAAEGFTVLAAVLMIMGGLWSVFIGLTGIIKQAFYVAIPNYTFNLSLHAWGWTHLIIGAVVVAAGACLLLGMLWARVVGVVLAVISAIANFLFLPHYPIWSIIVIAIDVFIIWALVSSGRRVVA